MNNEKGYTLFLAVLIGVLFSIMAASLVAFTSSGINKNDTREEDNQITGLSQKGLTHITNYINSELKKELGEDGKLQEEFIEDLEDILNDLHCDNLSEDHPFSHVENETGNYEVCVEDWDEIIDPDGNKVHTRKKVWFRSTGMIKDKEKEMRSAVIVGAQAVPDALYYAIGSHKVCDGTEKGQNKRNCVDGEGNLFLHGGVQIEGDLKVDGNIITTDRGYAYLSGERWIDSLYPAILPGPGNSGEKAKLILGEKVYKFHTKPSYNSHINSNQFKTNNYNLVDDLNDAFSYAPEIIHREPIRDIIVITEQKESYQFDENDVGVNHVEKTVFNEGSKYENLKVFASDEECRFLWWFCGEAKNYEFKGTNTFDQFATNGNLSIGSNYNWQKNSFKTTVKNGMYVGGDLTIGNGNISYNPDKYDDIQLDGTIYVGGNLTIQGADAKLNALIYVEGDVEIENTKINGLRKNGKEGSLIIFADGQIHIANNSVNQEDPSEIRGYFYSNDVFEMFGVGSNIKIEGGISAKRIVLNAIRGRASDKKFDGAQKVHGDYFEGVNGQKNRDSRLQVIYNPGIIGTYSDLKLEEPIIYNVDPPRLIERE